MIIMIAGTKGGTGKSTIAINAAVYQAHQKRDVLLVDLDPEQETSYLWAGRRATNWKNAPTVHREKASGDIYDVISDRAERYQDIIIDAGGYDSDAMRTGMLATSRVYFPIRPSQADLESIPRIKTLVQDVSKVNRGLRPHLVLSQVPTNQSGEEEGAREWLSEIEEFTLLNQSVKERKAYRDALVEGVGAIEMDDRKAKTEIKTLAEEMFNGQS